jgi:hypothetical protein
MNVLIVETYDDGKTNKKNTIKIDMRKTQKQKIRTNRSNKRNEKERERERRCLEKGWFFFNTVWNKQQKSDPAAFPKRNMVEYHCIFLLRKRKMLPCHRTRNNDNNNNNNKIANHNNNIKEYHHRYFLFLFFRYVCLFVVL